MEEELKPEQIVKAINNHEYDDLAEYLQEIRWDLIPIEEIIPKRKIMDFTKGINREHRVLVMQFLLDYGKFYFWERIEDKVTQDLFTPHRGPTSPEVIEKHASKFYNEFKQVLEVRISQMTKFEEKDVVVINRLQEENRKLEKKVKEQEEEIEKLRKKVVYYEHPSEHGKQIPDELNHKVFLFAMEFLVANGVAKYCSELNDYGFRTLTCYYWLGRKGAFGYFVDRINEELGLRKEGGMLKWKPFEKAFINYKDIIDEARNTVSYYTNKTQNGKTSKMPDLFPKTAEIVEKAIEYAREREKNDSQNQVKKH